MKQEGARSYTAYFSHPIFSKDELGADALEKLLTTKVEGKPGINAIDNLVFLDTIPDVAQKIEAFTATHPELADRISVLSAAPLLIQEMERQQSQTAGFTARREVGVRRQVGG